MSITIVSKNNEKTFNNLNVINIGTTQNCHFKLSLDYQILISLQKNENGKWYVVNSLKSNKILFKGQPVTNYLEIGNMCKLMIADSDEYVGIKINETVSSSNLKENTIEKKQTAQIVRRIDNKKTIKMIQEEDLTEQDIQ
ncbi:MAG: hypothetical protein LUG16_00555, partial [Candidatus Gastranaerophilales bacterium]|nr:hypothetical protein [Candidatus Gastranaerophilales bacterium]